MVVSGAKKVINRWRLGPLAATMACVAAVIAHGAEPNEIRVTVRLDSLPSIHVSAALTLSAEQTAGPILLFTEIGLDALQRISAVQGDRAITVDKRPLTGSKGRKSAGCFLPLAESGQVRFEYDVDPTFYPPGSAPENPADARARVTQDLGVLRTTTILPQRLISSADCIRFDLPEEWIAVTPWPERDGAFVLGERGRRTNPEYIGIGPFKKTEQTIDGIVYRLAVYPGIERIDNKSLVRLLNTECGIAGRPPGSREDIYCVCVVPRDFVHGGSAGLYSSVQPPDPVVLAHEMFHWWNHSRLTKPEGKWFLEGFTEYYGIRAAREAGLIDADFEKACFADLNGEMRHLEGENPVSLADASLAAAKDPKASRIVYSKGALVALLIARKLEVQGKSLNEIMTRILGSERGNLGNADLRQLFHEVYGGAIDDEFDRFVLDAIPLPDLRLPPATGTTGVAKYLPKQ